MGIIMKVVYYIGDSIGSDTVVSKGIIDENDFPLCIKAKEQNIILNNISSVETIKLNGLGTMLKIKNGDQTIFLAVYRVFFNIGTGFVIVNLLATLKLRKILDKR